MPPRWTVQLAIGMWVVLCLLFITLPLYAGEIAVAEDGRVRMYLFSEACTLESVKNLPGRATWTEGGTELEGCFAITDGIVVAYFADKTVVLVPLRGFRRVLSS